MKLPEFLAQIFSTGAQHDPLPQLLTDLEAVKRGCWVPSVEDSDGDITASKFSGIPCLKAGEDWPVCPNCTNPMQFFLQLNPETLPMGKGDIWGPGLLQFFYCTNDDQSCQVDCQAWAPHSQSTVLRIIPMAGTESAYSQSPVKNAFPAKQIVGWSRYSDYPGPEELGDSGQPLSDESSDLLGENYPRQGDKLLGWPAWVQGVEYPNCPKCDTQMQLVFQIDSNYNLPYMFGDVGCGHISQCPEHRTELAFGWACC